MSFNSKQYLAYEERRLELDSFMIKGNHKWHQPVIIKQAKVLLPPPDMRTEAEITAMQDEYLKQFGL